MVAKQIKRAGDCFQWIVDLMRNDACNPPHCRQSLCFAKSILRFQLSGDVSVNLKDCVAIFFEGLAACYGYFPAVTGKLGEVSVPFTGMCKCALHILQSLWKPGLQNVMDRFTHYLLTSPAIERLCTRVPE